MTEDRILLKELEEEKIHVLPHTYRPQSSSLDLEILKGRNHILFIFEYP